MIDYIRRHLVIKLFLTYLMVILIGIFVLAVTTQFTMSGAFNHHLEGMGRRMGWGSMTGGEQGQGFTMMHDLFIGFRAGFNEALIWAALTATVLALVVSLIFSRNVTAPVRAMMGASQRIAEGHYDERVQLNGLDELGQLACRFNQMAEKLEQVETMRRQLIGDVAHELRTPLTSIKGSLEGLMDGVLPANDTTFKTMHHEAERLSRLVDDLQELSRVETGAYKMDIKPIAVSHLVDTALHRLRQQFTNKDVSLTYNLPDDLPRVIGDEDRIGQIMINIVGNALQYTPIGGNVHVSAARQGGEVQISVKDTGIGIPSEHLPHIFDRFYRVDKSRSRRISGGSGIGLTIAKHLIEAHGGRIWAESEGKGQGSTFVP